MPAPPLSNSFDGGSAGATIDASNSGGASGNIFSSAIGSAITYSSVQVHSGRFAACGVDLTGTGWLEWDTLGSITSNVYFRWYMYLSAYPTTSHYYPLRLQTTGGASACAFLRVVSDGTGHMSAADSTLSGVGAEGSVAVALNRWVRVEARVLPSATAGQIEWRLYNTPDSQTISDSFNATGLTLGANIDVARWGMPVAPPATPFTFYIDDVAVSTSGWIGTGQTTYVSTVLADSPRAYYRMNEASGQPQDSSGNSMHTTVTNGSPTYRQPGPLLSDVSDKAIGFLASNSDYFEAPDNAILDYGDVFTLEAWVKRGGTGAVEHFIVGKGDDGVNRAGGLYIQDDRVMLAQTDVAPMIYSTTHITDTTRWHHIVATKNGATMRTYVDGRDVTDLATASNLTCQNTSRPLTIGAEYNGAGGHGSYMAGGLDEVAVYNTALSAERVWAHYAAGVRMNDIPLVDNFNRANGTIASTTASDGLHVWSATQGGGSPIFNLNIVSNQLGCNSAEDSYITTSFGPDTDAYYTINATTNAAASPYIVLYQRGQATGPYQASWDSYTLYVGMSDTDSSWRIQRVNPYTDYTGIIPGPFLRPGDRIRFTCIGSDLTGYHNPGTGWTQIVSTVEYDIPHAGKVGIGIQDLGVTHNVRLDNLYVGTIGAVNDVYSETVLALGPQLYYKLQETGGERAIDYSGNARDAIIWNQPALAQPGILPGRSAYSVNLSASNLTSIAPHTAYLGFAGGNFTACGWAYRNNTAARHTLIGTGDAVGGDVLLAAASGSTDANWWSDVGFAFVTWTGAIPTAEAFHWAITYTDATKTSELFINGISLGTKVSTNNFNSPGNVTFGNWTGAQGWSGRQSHNAFFTSVLSAAQIRAIYLAGIRAPRGVPAAAMSGVGW